MIFIAVEIEYVDASNGGDGTLDGANDLGVPSFREVWDTFDDSLDHCAPDKKRYA